MRPALARAGDAVFLLATLPVVYLLKRHYQGASTGELAWILSPTVRLVEAVTGVGFQYEPSGYISTEALFVIAPVWRRPARSGPAAGAGRSGPGPATR